MAVCGEMIVEKDGTALPSCPRCEAYWQLILKAMGVL